MTVLKAQTRAYGLILITACLTCQPTQALGQANPTPPPKTLQECYLQIVQTKASADAAHVARQLCDAVFKKPPRSIVLLDASSKVCIEWWLDPRGRYESAATYCAFTREGSDAWTLACQSKAKPSQFTYMELRENGDTFEPHGKTLGENPGQIFRSFAACIRHKAQS